MITVEKVVIVDGRLENIGDWDFMPYEVEIIGNPFPGPMDAPPGWDFQISYERRFANPLPEGAIIDEREVFFDRAGSARLVDQAAELEHISRVQAAAKEFDELWKDVSLGLATPEETARAAELRTFLKENPL